jgi:hypothetical protein
MKYVKVVLAVVTLLAVIATTSSAALYEDYQYIGITLSADNDEYSHWFDISPPYVPGTETFQQAEATFTIRGRDNIAEKVSFLIGPDSGDGEVLFGRQLFGGSISLEAMLSLGDNGFLSYCVRWVSGDDPFKLEDAYLIAETSPNSQAVPDGGTTLGLLGMAMIGLEWGRRKVTAFRSKN